MINKVLSMLIMTIIMANYSYRSKIKIGSNSTLNYVTLYSKYFTISYLFFFTLILQPSMYILHPGKKCDFVLHRNLALFRVFPYVPHFFSIWRSAGTFFALIAMRSHFFRFFQYIFFK